MDNFFKRVLAADLLAFVTHILSYSRWYELDNDKRVLTQVPTCLLSEAVNFISRVSSAERELSCFVEYGKNFLKHQVKSCAEHFEDRQNRLTFKDFPHKVQIHVQDICTKQVIKFSCN